MKAPRILTREQWPPDYTSVFLWRQQQIIRLTADPVLLMGAEEYYSQPEHAAEFVTHWVDTFDPRLAFQGDLPARLPFVFFERQAEQFDFLFSCLADQTNGLIDKSRDMGATWGCAAFSVWLWKYRPGAAIGWGSRKEELVDKLGDPKSIFEKMRQIINGLPRFFLPKGFEPDKHATFMRLINPENGATIIGEGGDNIGRGGRTLIYFKDEAAHLEHAESVEAALMDNTNVQIDISTTAGIGTVFDRKREAGRIWEPRQKPIPKGTTRVFILDWSDHPDKTEAWHTLREKESRDNGLLHLFRQEVDRDPGAALQGVIIKPEWVKAAVDAHIDLKFGDAGEWCAGFDPFDEGGDLHAFSMRKGVVLRVADDWGEGDTGEATRRVIVNYCLGKGAVSVQYDSVGIGAGVKSEANRLARDGKMPRGVTFQSWDAGLAALRPKERLIPGDSSTPTNEDFFANLKAQAWWALARRFEKVYRMRQEPGLKYRPEELISLDGQMPKLRSLMRELSQPVMVKSSDLRLKVDKKPEGARSPNLADSVVMNYFPVKIPMVISEALLQKALER